MTKCIRCDRMKEQAFLIQPNPSAAWGEIDLSTPPQPITISCKECLTDEEIARFLAPVALFVIQTALRHAFWDENPEKRNKEAIQHFGYAEAYLRFRCGVDSNERTKALRALNGLIEVHA